jgi:hypothetical protein
MTFIKWPKIPRFEHEIFHFSEKLDGTNACIVVSNGEIAAQSRTRFVTPEDDNYGFAQWVFANKDQLINDLGEGHHFGEWWGQGIQRNYDLKEKRFSLFNPNKKSSLCSNVPIFYSCSFHYVFDMIEEFKIKLKTGGSIAAPNYMKPEGFVIYGEQSHSYWKVIIDK